VADNISDVVKTENISAQFLNLQLLISNANLFPAEQIRHQKKTVTF
jgi:hypothetical protein